MRTRFRPPISLALLALASAVLAETGPQHSERVARETEQNRSSPREISLRIVDEGGAPIEQAETRSIQYSIKLQLDNISSIATDAQGRSSHHIAPYFAVRDIYVDRAKDDKRIGKMAYELHLNDQDFIIYKQLSQSFNLTLPSVLKPIPLKAKREGFTHLRVNKPGDKWPADPRLPDLAITEIGYDAEMLEPVEPHGKGKHADFTITLTSTFTGFDDAWTKRSAEADAETKTYTFDEGKVHYGNWIHTATYRFSNKGDGIILSPQFWPYCKLTVPHKAPEDGYVGEITLKEARNYHAPRANLSNYRERIANNGMFLRIRTKLDKDGNVISANYAKIVSPQGAGNVFLVFYNPTPNDRNLEYDFKTNLRWKELHPTSKEPPPWNSPYDVNSN